MSFILDALERSRSERDALHADPVLSRVADAQGVQAGRFPWVPVLLLALLLSLTATAWLWISRVTDTDIPAESPAPEFSPRVSSTAAAPPVAAPSATATEEALPRPAQAESASSPAVRELYSAARSAQVTAVEEAAPAEGRADRPRTAPPDESVATEAAAVAPLEIEATARDSGEDRDAAVGDTVDAMVARAEAALDNQGLAPHPAPMLEELSQGVRNEIPTLMYSQHDYRESGGDSRVFINREHRQAGDSIGGVRVEEILPDSVVLTYRGTVFRLRALNSWVNL